MHTLSHCILFTGQKITLCVMLRELEEEVCLNDNCFSDWIKMYTMTSQQDRDQGICVIVIHLCFSTELNCTHLLYAYLNVFSVNKNNRG